MLIESKKSEKIFLISSHNISFVNSFKERKVSLIHNNSLKAVDEKLREELHGEILRILRP